MAGTDVCTPETLGGQVRVAVTRIARQLRAQRGDVDLPEGQFAVLTSLTRHGPMTPGALAGHERIRPPSMTRTVNALVELGLVTKVGDPGDRRLVVVAITDAGRDEVTETRRRRDAWLTRELERLTDAERAVLAEASVLLTRIASS